MVVRGSFVGFKYLGLQVLLDNLGTFLRTIEVTVRKSQPLICVTGVSHPCSPTAGTKEVRDGEDLGD